MQNLQVAAVLLAAAGSAAAAPTRLVAGQRLPVLDAEPALDEGTFVAAGSLARTYRAKLVSTSLDDSERADLQRDTLPAKGLFLVRIRRDGAGKHYLYKPCDAGHHQRTLVTTTHVYLLGTEPLVVPIAKQTRRGRLTTIELDTTGFSPMVATKLRLRSTGGGVYELAVGDDDFSDLVATPAAAAKLDVVVRVCKTAKAAELDFTRR